MRATSRFPKIGGLLAPARPTLVPAAPAGEEWLHEIKYDGYRMVAVRQGRDVKVWSRQGTSWLKRLDCIRESLLRLPSDDAILDGEAVALDDNGLPDFHALMGREGQANAVMFVWDVLCLDGVGLRSRPLIERKACLKKLLRKARGLNYVNHIQGEEALVFDHACRMGLEGIISKLANSTYTEGATRNWLKVKNPHYGRAPMNWRRRTG